ncbi:unannotated protein [freshwater metagenome]|uniref:Unannotated protein n=1 Tax=freshwater metagenome TaxID=449393 RepID=A0A6J7USD4_9ZZZZ
MVEDPGSLAGIQPKDLGADHRIGARPIHPRLDAGEQGSGVLR